MTTNSTIFQVLLGCKAAILRIVAGSLVSTLLTQSVPDAILKIQIVLRSEPMKASIKKWGNSAAIRIPLAVLEATAVKLDEEVDIREEAGRIVIEPVRETKYKLNNLLKGITKDNIHGEINFGRPEGKEVW